jgi:hypothetical protein
MGGRGIICGRHHVFFGPIRGGLANEQFDEGYRSRWGKQRLAVVQVLTGSDAKCVCRGHPAAKFGFQEFKFGGIYGLHLFMPYVVFLHCFPPFRDKYSEMISSFQYFFGEMKQVD